MEDIVALEVQLTNGEKRYFLTWGRLYGGVEYDALVAAVTPNLKGFSLGGTPESVRVCFSLQEASDAPYFYEALFTFSQETIPFGPKYKSWAKKMRKKVEAGKELYYLGRPRLAEPDGDRGSEATLRPGGS